MFNYNIQKVDNQLSNELKMNRIGYVTPKPSRKKGVLETPIRCFTSKTDILSMRLCYKVSFC